MSRSMAGAFQNDATINAGTLLPVDLSPWAAGNTGIPFVSSFESHRPGPHILLNALTHGNEVCGAHALDCLLRQQIRPARGRLSFSFANIAAYAAYDPGNPTQSRFLDCDFNRLWSPAVLGGTANSREHARARALRPLIDTVDYLLDIHSMQHPSPPLMLCGLAPKGSTLARKVGIPQHLMVDSGHAAGVRLRDYDRFSDPTCHQTALLVECGQHLAPASRDVALETCYRFLLALGMLDQRALAQSAFSAHPLPLQRLIDVTEAVTVASDDFHLVGSFAGMQIIEQAGTVIAMDGTRPVTTPYDHCVLIMPTERASRGQTAVRFGRYRD